MPNDERVKKKKEVVFKANLFMIYLKALVLESVKTLSFYSVCSLEGPLIMHQKMKTFQHNKWKLLWKHHLHI